MERACWTICLSGRLTLCPRTLGIMHRCSAHRSRPAPEACRGCVLLRPSLLSRGRLRCAVAYRGIGEVLPHRIDAPVSGRSGGPFHRCPRLESAPAELRSSGCLGHSSRLRQPLPLGWIDELYAPLFVNLSLQDRLQCRCLRHIYQRIHQRAQFRIRGD